MYRSIDIEVQKNPIPFLNWIRAQGPVYRDPDTGVFFVTRDEEIRRITLDTTTFSSVIDPTIFRVVQGKSLERDDPQVADYLKEHGWLVPTTLLLTDPPEHTRFRRLVQEALNPRSVQVLSGNIQQRVRELIAQFAADGRIEFMEDFAKRLPIWVIGSFIFGAPEQDFHLFNDWADQFFRTLMPAAPREEYLRTVDVVIEMHRYVKNRIDAFRAEPDDKVLLSRLLRIHETTGDQPLSDEELLSMMQVFLLAGHDTTRQTLGNGLFELARRPALQARLRAEPARIGDFINEVLRLHAPSNVTPRIAACDTEISGVAITKGSMIFVAWGSANRDERVHPDADGFDIDRADARKSLSFGWGIHHCVGAHLARAQITIAIEELLRELGEIRLNVDETQLEYAPNMNSRGLLRLPLRVQPNSVAGAC